MYIQLQRPLAIIMVLRGRNEALSCSDSADWVRLLKRPGLVVVDIFTWWAGPCEIMMPFILKLKAQIQENNTWNFKNTHDHHLPQVSTGNDSLVYATACSDSVPQLSMLKGVCKPLFLFLVDGNQRLTSSMSLSFCQGNLWLSRLGSTSARSRKLSKN